MLSGKLHNLSQYLYGYTSGSEPLVMDLKDAKVLAEMLQDYSDQAHALEVAQIPSALKITKMPTNVVQLDAFRTCSQQPANLQPGDGDAA